MGVAFTLTMLRAAFFLLAFCTFSYGQLDPTSVLLIGLNDFEAVDVPDTEDDQITKCENSGLVPEYPIDGTIFEAASAFINGMVMVCGGFDGQAVHAECFALRPEPGDVWEPLKEMMYPVFRGGFSKFGNPEEEGEFFWVGGGSSDAVSAVSSSQIYDSSTGTWFEGPELPMALDGPCFAKLDNTHTLVTGGYQNGEAKNWIYDFDNYEFIPVGDFVGGDRMVHGCAAMADGRVMVAGGYQGLNTPEAKVLNTVEFFDPETKTWSEGPSLPAEGLDGNILVGLSTGGWAGDVLLLGGHIPDSITGGDWITSDSIWRFKTAENEWELTDYKMKLPRTHFTVVSTPFHCDED